MSWTTFWSEAANIGTMISNISSSFPNMVIEILFAGVTLSAVYAMVKMVREVRS